MAMAFQTITRVSPIRGAGAAFAGSGLFAQAFSQDLKKVL